MKQITLCIVLLLISVTNSQRIFYVITGDANFSPGIFAFGENGTLLSWFGQLSGKGVFQTGIFNHLDGLFYIHTYAGYQIVNPATETSDSVDSQWPSDGYAISVKPIDSTQFEIVSGTVQGLYTYNPKTSQFTMLNTLSGNDSFNALTVSPIDNKIYGRNGAGIHAINATDGSLRLIKADWSVFQMIADPLDQDNLFVSQDSDTVRTLEINAGVTQLVYNHDLATFTLSPDGFSYALSFCCSNDANISRFHAQNGIPFMKDDNFGFDVEKPILDATGEDYANYRYMTVMWSPPRVDLCSNSGSKSITMQFKRYNWTGSMELQVANLFEPVYQTVATITPDNYMEETVIKSFDLSLYKNTSVLYRFRIKYIGRIQWPGYSLHREITMSSTTFNAVGPCPSDFITTLNPPTSVQVPASGTVEGPIEVPVTAPMADAGVIAPAVIIPVVGSAAIAVLVILLIKRKQKQNKKRVHSQAEQSMGETNYTSIVSLPNIVNKEMTVTNPLNTSPKGDRMNISRANLVIGKEIGKGSYGRVYLGEWNSTTVAIKVATTAGTVTFEKELELMLHLTPHPNVVQILGYSYEGVIPLLVLEYCNGGGMDKIVFDHSRPLTVQQQLTLVAGIARGILHLHNNNVVHRDIAARNVLLSSSGEPKVADFGFSRLVETTGGQTDSTVGPVCWMAPESLKSQKYSFKTDVWSFGILMYEVLARQEPYKGKSVLDVGQKIRDEGMTPDESIIDESVPHELREIMKSCWKVDPDQRPTFQDICTRLDALKKDFNLSDRVGGQPTSPNLRDLI